MMNYVFKTETGKTATVRACDKEQAKILAIVRYGREFLYSKCVGFNNKA